jgi:hypothetical protein
MAKAATEWRFQLNRNKVRHVVVLRDRAPIIIDGKQVGATGRAIAIFENGLFTTDKAEVADLMFRHKRYNDPDPVLGFRLLDGEAMAAPSVQPTTADAIAYEKFSRESLVRMCEERRIKSYGNKEELIARLEDADTKARHKAGDYSDKEKARILKKYPHEKLLEMAKELKVQAPEGATDAVVLEALIACGAEFDV